MEVFSCSLGLLGLSFYDRNVVIFVTLFGLFNIYYWEPLFNIFGDKDRFMVMDRANDIKNSIKTLREGGTIIYSTDTIWGLGCDATNSLAVDKIFNVKKREETKSLIILVDSIAMLERYVADVPDIAYQLVEVADTPLTIVYPCGKNLAPGVCAADGSVGIRVCEEPFCAELIRGLRKPIVSTSANFSGAPSPATFSDIDPKLLEVADFVVEYRRDDPSKGKASSLIKVNTDGSIVVLRK